MFDGDKPKGEATEWDDILVKHGIKQSSHPEVERYCMDHALLTGD